MKESSAERELRIRKEWEKDHTFERSISNREGKETFVFYEGRQQQTACRMPVTLLAER